MEHYFLTYKLVPGQASVTEIDQIYGLEQAKVIVNASLADYLEEFPAH